MHGIAQLFMEGGWSVYLVVGFSLVHAIVVIVQYAIVKKADITPYLWGGLAGIALIGLLGGLMGFAQGFRAMSSASPDQQAALMAVGMARGLSNGLVTTLMVLPGVIFIGIASCLTRNLTPVRLRD